VRGYSSTTMPSFSAQMRQATTWQEEQRGQVILDRVGGFAFPTKGWWLVDLDPIRAKSDRAGDRVVGGGRSTEDNLGVGRVGRNRVAVGSDDAA